MFVKIKKYTNRIKDIFIEKRRNPRKFLYRMTWVACISVCIPIILAGSLYYKISMDRTTKQIITDSQSSLSLAMTRMERVLQGIEKDAFQLANNPTVKESLANQDFENDILSHRDILDAILFQKTTSNFIDEIYYYNNDSKVVLSNKFGYIKIEDFNYKTDIEDVLKTNKQACWANLPKSSKEGYISYIIQIPILSTAKPHGLFIIEIKRDVLETYFMDNFKFSDIQASYILNSDSEILFNTKAREYSKTLAINPSMLSNIIYESTIQGSFYGIDLQGKPVFYTFNKALFGRTYITMVPKSEIVKKLAWIKWFVFLVSIIPLSIGIILTIINSRRIYNPIEQLLDYGYNLSNGNIINQSGNEIIYIRECLDYLNKEAKTLGNYVKEVGPSLREKFLLQLLTGSYDNCNSTLNKDCEIHNIPINKNYLALIIDLENFETQKLNGANDKLVASIAVANIMGELLDGSDKNLNGYIINNGQGRNIVALYFSQGISYDDAIHIAYEFGRQIYCEVLKKLSYIVYIGIGRVYSNIADITVSYNEAAQALQYRLYMDSDYILYIDDLGKQKKQTVVFYPHEFEKSIVEYLDASNVDKAKGELKEFASIVKSSESYNFIRQSYQMLLSAVIFSFEKNGGSILDLLENNLFEQLKECNTSKEIFNWFINKLFPLYNALVSGNENNNGKNVVLKICKYVKENIVHDISLVQCAELVGMSPSYVSRLFKKEIGISFLDYVIKCKVDEVKRLLVETDDGISQIAATVGYSERNLYRIFQRCTKMSPNEYRLINR